jgi:Conjugal transfer protein TraD
MQELINKLKTYTQPSAQQKLLILLASNTSRSPSDEKKLKVLLAAEVAADKAAKAKAKAKALIRDDEKKKAADERKARNHRLILQGTLFDLSGLMDWSRGEMLGALLEVAAKSEDVDRRATWKQQGDALLSEKGG